MRTTVLTEMLALLCAGTIVPLGQEANAPTVAQVNDAVAAVTNAAAAVDALSGTPTPQAASQPEAPTLSADSPVAEADAAPKNGGEPGIKFNFRGVPLETVLNYMSEAAGFIIVMQTRVSGTVDAWSKQPLTKDEAVDLLDTILNQKGYAAIRSGRKLAIVGREEAKRMYIPVIKENDPEKIPRSDEMVTQIVPVRSANAVQLLKDLTPLKASFSEMTANESGNALVITDTQANIRRMAEIVKAIDSSISGITSVKVFTLKFADAKDLATVIKELFPAQASSGSNRGGGGGFNPMAMMGRGGMRGGGGGGGDTGTGQSEARNAASKVTAVADERTNSLIVSAPKEIVELIEELVTQIDTNGENVTELRVFHLVHADPQETADLLTSLFPDTTTSSGNRSRFQFGGGPFGMMRGGGGNTGTQGSSSRAQQQGKVTAVADPRTGSLIVSAARDLMPNIEEMIARLDSDPAKKQIVRVYSLENADVDGVAEVLQEMFQTTSSMSRNSRNNQNNNALSSRQTQNNQQMGQNSRSSSRTSGSSLP